MSLEIKSKGNTTIISYLNWSISVYLEDGGTCHAGIPYYTSSADLTYIYEGATFYDKNKKTFLSAYGVPTIHIGYVNESKTRERYYTVTVSKEGCKITYIEKDN
jgi:hypothetical protein